MIIAKPPVRTNTVIYEQTVAAVVFLHRLEKKIPMLPKKIAVVIISNINCIKSMKLIPPMEKTIATMGIDENANNNIMLIDEANLPSTICNVEILVVSKISNVCFSRSPEILPAVIAGIINKINTYSIPIIIPYMVRISEYST